MDVDYYFVWFKVWDHFLCAHNLWKRENRKWWLSKIATWSALSNSALSSPSLHNETTILQFDGRLSSIHFLCTTCEGTASRWIASNKKTTSLPDPSSSFSIPWSNANNSWKPWKRETTKVILSIVREEFLTKICKSKIILTLTKPKV